MVVLQIRLESQPAARHFYVVHDENDPLLQYLPEVLNPLHTLKIPLNVFSRVCSLKNLS